MKFRDFLSDKAVTLSFIAAAVLTGGAFALLAGADWRQLLPAVLSAAALIILWVVTVFFYEKRKTDKLAKAVEGLEEKYLLGEILPAPRGAAERMYYDIMRRLSRDAVGRVRHAERDKDDYCEYVTAWVHEIKTPLTACRLMTDNGADCSKLRPQLKKAENLTDCILYYARLKSAYNDRRLVKTDGAALAAEAVKSMREILVAAGCSVKIEGEGEWYADDKAVRFMLCQLLVNCAKHCAGCKIVITVSNNGVTVKDDGIGVAAHELPRLTQRGFTGGGRSGTGMGLYIVAQLCEQLDMTLNISSKLNSHTEISLNFASSYENVS